MNKKTVAGLIVIVVIVSVIIFSGCVEEETSAPTVTPTPTPKTELSLGESAVIHDVSFMVVRYEVGTDIGDKRFPEGATSLWIYVKGKNVGEVPRSLPYFYDVELLYKGTSPTAHDPSVFWLHGTSKEGYTGGGEIYPGVVREGWILYTVPEGVDTSQVKIRVTYAKEQGLFKEVYGTKTWSLAS
jgi:hypothetical protein